MPHNMSKVRYLLRRKRRRISPFDPYNFFGQSSTHYHKWVEQKDAEFHDIRCIKSNRYEPYVVFRYCQDLPPFQTHFSGYGKNKLTWIMHLRRLGYKFTQIGG